MHAAREDADKRLNSLRNKHAEAVKQFRQKEANLLDACKQVVAKGDAEIDRVNARHLVALQSITKDHEMEREQLKASHSAELEQVQKELESLRQDQSKYKNRLDRQKQQFEAELKQIEDHHAKELAERDASVFDAEEVLLKKDEKIEELIEELRNMHQKQTVELENVRRQHAEELLAVESAHRDELTKLQVSHTEELATAAETTEKYHESLRKIEEKELELKDLDAWGEYMEQKHKFFEDCFVEKEQRIEQLKKQLKQSHETTANLEERLNQSREATANLQEQLKQSRETLSSLEERLNQSHKNRGDSELQRQLALEKLNCNKLQTQLVCAQDKFDDKMNKLAEQNARLLEDKRELQNTIRRQQNSLNDTYADQRPAAATAMQPPADHRYITDTGAVQEGCLHRYEAEVSRLRKELEKKEKENKRANDRVKEWETYVMQRKMMAAKQQQQKYMTPLTATQPAAAAAAESVVGMDTVEERIDKVSDCKPQ